MDGGMFAKYISQIISIAFRFSVRFADALQIIAFIAIPAFYKLLGAPMPDGGVEAFAMWIAYAVVTLITFRLVIYAPYILWKEQSSKNEGLIEELQRPERVVKQKMLEATADDYLKLSKHLGEMKYWLEAEIRKPKNLIQTGAYTPLLHLNNARQKIGELAEQLSFDIELRNQCMDAINLCDCIVSDARSESDYREDKKELTNLVATLQAKLRFVDPPKAELPVPQSLPDTESEKQH